MNRLLEARDWIALTGGRPPMHDAATAPASYRTIEFRPKSVGARPRKASGEQRHDCEALDLAS